MDDGEVALAAKFEELHLEAVSHGVEWLRRALSDMLSSELRALAAVGGVETRPDNKWLTVAELRSALMKVLLPPSEARGCKMLQDNARLCVISKIKRNGIRHTWHHGTKLFWAIYVGVSRIK